MICVMLANFRVRLTVRHRRNLWSKIRRCSGREAYRSHRRHDFTVLAKLSAPFQEVPSSGIYVPAGISGRPSVWEAGYFVSIEHALSLYNLHPNS